MICPACGAENRTGARFCDACGAALASEGAREVRKVVTVLFCDVSGSTALGERLDPEALRTVMARYFAVARAAIERHGGTVEKFIGDAVMAVFGESRRLFAELDKEFPELGPADRRLEQGLRRAHGARPRPRGDDPPLRLGCARGDPRGGPALDCGSAAPHEPRRSSGSSSRRSRRASGWPVARARPVSCAGPRRCSATGR